MKKLLVPITLLVSVMLLLSGCVAAIGNKGNQPGGGTTLGQQLMDLQKAKDTGAMSDAEYQSQRAKLLKDK